MILARRLLFAAALASPFGGAQAQNISREVVRFQPGASSTEIHGMLSGYRMVDYVVTVGAGQTLSVSLRSDTGVTSFNVTAPGAQRALFVGASSGSNFRRRLSSGGAYTIRVFQMRQGARRQTETAYTLAIGLEGPSR